MKINAIIAIVLFLSSCENGVSQKEEDYIRLRIDRHNEVFFDFIKDSTNERQKKGDSIYAAWEDKYILSLADTNMQMLYKRNNAAYYPNADRHLDYKKFMTWCAQHHADPVREARRLKVK